MENLGCLSKVSKVPFELVECVVCSEAGTRLDQVYWATVIPEPCAKAVSPYVDALHGKLCSFPDWASQLRSHDLDICKSCIAAYIATQIEDNKITNIRCPDLDCDREFTFSEIQSLACADVFKR